MLSIFFQYLTAYEILYCLQTASFVLDADGTIGTNELYSAVRVINVKLQFKLCMFHFFPNYINKWEKKELYFTLLQFQSKKIENL